MNERELLSVVNAEFETAMGAEGGEISTERARAWDYYLSKPLGNEIEGQSQVVSSDVAEVVDSLMPSLLRMFTTKDNLISFDPADESDESLAEQETDYTNHVFFKRINYFMLMYTWFFDALVQKNGIVKLWWDESEEITTESYTGLTQAELVELLEDEELEPLERAEREVDGVVLHDVDFRRVCKTGKPAAENIPPEEFRISSDARSIYPDKARMVGHERQVKRSDLIDMGFDKKIVEDLPSEGEHNQDTPEKIARYDRTDEYRSEGSHDRSQDEILVRECYVRVDYDDDGRAELRHVIIAGNKVLENEVSDRCPFHVISPKPLPHKHFGLSKADDVMDIQQISSTLERQALDNLYLTNNPEQNVWEQAIGDDTMDDLLNRRAGSINRFTRPVSESVSPNVIPFTAQASFGVLEYYDKKVRDRTGVHSDAEGLSPEALKNIQTGVLTQAMDMSRAKVEVVARIFSETGIKTFFLHLHELLKKHQNKAEVFRLRGQWIESNPSDWRTRPDLTVNIGLGVGSREQNLLHLEAVWNKQLQLVQSGGANTVVTPAHLYRTGKEIAKNANLPNPEVFFNNPGDAQFNESDEQIQLQQQQQQLAQRQQALDAERQAIAQAELNLKTEKALDESQRANAELRRKVEKDADDFAIAMEEIRNQLIKMELDHEVELPEAQL